MFISSLKNNRLSNILQIDKVRSTAGSENQDPQSNFSELVISPVQNSKMARPKTQGLVHIKNYYPKGSCEGSAKPLNLVLTTGKLIVITGPPKTGKSQFLRKIAGLDMGSSQTSGKVISFTNQVAYLSQNSRVSTSMTPFDSFSKYFGAFDHPFSRSNLEEKISSWGISPREFATNTNSRKLATIRSILIPKRDLYCLDQPALDMDYEDLKRLIRQIVELVASGATVVLNTCDRDLLRAADKIVLLSSNGSTAVITTSTEMGVIRTRAPEPQWQKQLLYFDAKNRVYLYAFSKIASYLYATKTVASETLVNSNWARGRLLQQFIVDQLPHIPGSKGG